MDETVTFVPCPMAVICAGNCMIFDSREEAVAFLDHLHKHFDNVPAAIQLGDADDPELPDHRAISLNGFEATTFFAKNVIPAVIAKGDIDGKYAHVTLTDDLYVLTEDEQNNPALEPLKKLIAEREAELGSGEMPSSGEYQIKSNNW